MQMQPERFAFDRIFSACDAEPADTAKDSSLEVAALRAELALLRSDREAAIATARAEGFEVGVQQARAERDAAVLTAVDALHGAIEALDGRCDEVAQRMQGDAAELALAAAELMAGRALEHAPIRAIDEAIGRALKQVARGTEIAIRVAPTLAEIIEKRVADRQARDRRRLFLTVIPDETLVEGDARLVWEEGELALRADARRAAVRAELETLLPAPPPATDPVDCTGDSPATGTDADDADPAEYEEAA